MLISQDIRPSSRKTQIIKKNSCPKTVKAVTSITALCGFFWKYIKDFSLIAAPLYQLDQERECSFPVDSSMPDRLWNLEGKISFPILQFPDWDHQFHLATDASQQGIGCVLFQKDPQSGHMLPRAYAGRSFSNSEKKYEVTKH